MGTPRGQSATRGFEPSRVQWFSKHAKDRCERERFSRKTSMDRAMADPVVRARDLWKSYDGRADVLCGVDLDVVASEAVLVFGPNGSGKTTLLSLLGGLDVPSRGTVAIGGEESSRLKGTALAKIRLPDVGVG